MENAERAQICADADRIAKQVIEADRLYHEYRYQQYRNRGFLRRFIDWCRGD